MKINITKRNTLTLTAEDPEEWKQLQDFRDGNNAVIDLFVAPVFITREKAEYYCTNCCTNTDGGPSNRAIACYCSMWDREEGKPVFDHWRKIKW